MPKAAKAAPAGPRHGFNRPPRQYLETVIGPPPQRAMAMGAYFHFLSDMRTKYKAENPDFKVPEMSKHIGELWKKLSTKEKKQYEAKAEQLKAQYTADLDTYRKKAQKIRDKRAREMEQYKRKAAQVKAQFEDELRKHPGLAALKEQYESEEAKHSEAAELKAQCDSQLDRLSCHSLMSFDSTGSSDSYGDSGDEDAGSEES